MKLPGICEIAYEKKEKKEKKKIFLNFHTKLIIFTKYMQNIKKSILSLKIFAKYCEQNLSST